MVALALLVAWCGGCQGAPQYAGKPSTPNNKLSLGWGRSLELGSETDATLEGFKTSSGVQIDKLTLKSSPATTMSQGWVPAMDAYGRQQVNFDAILKTHYEGLNEGQRIFWSGLNESLATAAPVFTQYLAGRNMAKQASAMKPKIIDELLGLAVTGQADVRSLPLNELPPGWANEIIARLNALEAAKKEPPPADDTQTPPGGVGIAPLDPGVPRPAIARR